MRSSESRYPSGRRCIFRGCNGLGIADRGSGLLRTRAGQRHRDGVRVLRHRQGQGRGL